MSRAQISGIAPFFVVRDVPTRWPSIVEFFVPLQDTHDGLRGFELKDADGYVLFFGRTR